VSSQFTTASEFSNDLMSLCFIFFLFLASTKTGVWVLVHRVKHLWCLLTWSFLIKEHQHGVIEQKGMVGIFVGETYASMVVSAT
jgi:hypothetical protein